MRKLLRAHKEALKSILLVVLVGTMLFQTAYTWIYGLDLSAAPDGGWCAEIIKFFGYDKDGSRLSGSVQPAAYPVKAMVRGKQGLYGVQFNENGVGAVCEKTKQLWSDAFDGAGLITQAEEEDYKNALLKPFFFMEYDGCLPLNVIAGWFGVRFSDENKAEKLFAGSLLLTRLEENSYYLYIRDAKTGMLYESKTSLHDQDFTVADTFLANGCMLAAELGENYDKYLPETMIFNTPIAFDILKSTKPTFVAQEASGGMASGRNDSVRLLLEAFSYNPYTRKKYEDENGNAETFVENYRTLRVEKNGRIRFQAADLSGGIEAYARGERSGTDAQLQCIELGRAVTEKVISSMGASGQVALTKWYYIPSSNTYAAVFSARAGGIPIDSAETGFFARYEFRGNMMVRALLNLRQYTKAAGEKQLYILPEKQLAAATDGKGTAGLSIRYEDAEGEAFCTAGWKLYRQGEQ